MDEELTAGGFAATGVDLDHANAARMYDYFLGGAHNFAVDRRVAAQVAAAHPEIAAVARANRSYLRRVVTWCQDRGIDQFLDLGSGVPTVGNVHEIAHRRDTSARVAYVDLEPVAAAHATEIVADLAAVTATHADLRDPHGVLAAPGVAGLLDFTRPVAVLAIAVLHFVDDHAAAAALAGYRAALAPGSVLALSHASHDHDDPAVAAHVTAAAQAYAHSATPLLLRDRPQLRALLTDLEDTDLVDPGLVDVLDWPRPASDRAGAGGYAAVALTR